MLITILTLSYNSPNLLETINSVLAQDYEQIQYILVDDGTNGFSQPDITAYIQRSSKDNIVDFNVISNVKNLGTVKTANIALSHAKGEYIFFLAGDDIFADTAVISDWVVAFKTSSALVMTAYRNVYDHNLTTFLERMPLKSHVNKIKRLSSQKLFEDIAVENFILGCCTAYSKKCFDIYGKYNERYRLIEDHPMILHLLRQGVAIKFFDRVVVCYRSNGTSSPLRYNTAYEQDVDLIFTHEVEPYVPSPQKSKRLHEKWKQKRQHIKKLQHYIYMNKKNTAKVIFARLWFHAQYPRDSIVGLLLDFGKIKRLFRK